MAYYTAGEFAKMAGISARMLRHYDEKGLLKPSEYTESGYRLYTDQDLFVLQRIVALRYLNFSLPQIQSVLQLEQGQDIKESLRKQKEEFLREQEHLRQIIQVIEHMERMPENEFNWEELIKLMYLMNAEEQVQKRFEESWRREQCADLHMQYSTSQDYWLHFLFRMMEIQQGERVLELDAADGNLWVENAEWIPECQLAMMVPSEEVLQRIQKSVKDTDWKCQVDYKLVPTGRIVLPEESYDVIVANHLFIHSTDLEHVLKSCQKALRPGGRFYCTAIGHGHMKELLDIAAAYDSGVHFYNMDLIENFSMESGADSLSKYFRNVEWHRYEDSIETRDARAVFQYLWGTYSNIQNVMAHKKNGFLQYIQKEIEQRGILCVQKEQGIFSARRP